MMDLVRIENIRVIVIDDNQIQYNHLMDIFHAQGQNVSAVLLDDLSSIQKHIKKTWDVIFYSKAYDFDQDKLFELIKSSEQPYLPCLLLENQEDTKNRYALHTHFFDQVNLKHPKHLLFIFNKALQVSFLWREKQRLNKDLEAIQNQVKTTSENMQEASMIVQEGIVMESNQYFKEMFNIEDAFGLPLLDVLQPKDSERFKQQLKLININSAQTYHFEIVSSNTSLKNKNLSLKIFSNQEEESLNISISQPKEEPSSDVKVFSYYEKINQVLSTQNSNADDEKALISLIIDLNGVDINEQSIAQYIEQITKQMKAFFSENFIDAGPFQWIGITQVTEASTISEIQDKLSTLFRSLPLQIGYSTFKKNLLSEDQFNALYAQSKAANRINTSEPSNNKAPQKEKQEQEENGTTTPPTEKTSQTAAPTVNQNKPTPPLENKSDAFMPTGNSQTSLKFQQVYDKLDTNQHMFEATTIYTDSNGISYNLNYSDEPPLVDTASAIQIDQTAIKIACHDLYEFCQTTPDANIIINLHHSSIDNSLASYLESVLKQTPGLNPDKITLQFNAVDIINLNLQLHPIWKTLKQMNIGIGLRCFNFNTRKITLIGQMQPQICFMALNLAQILSSSTQHQYVQEQLSQFKNTNFVIRELNDMNEFADAWNVDCRYLQGQYFQDKLDQMANI